MKKSVLVIDTPSSCIMCPLCYYNEIYSEHECRGTNGYFKTFGIYGRNTKPEWCPLSPLPEYKDLTSHVTYINQYTTLGNILHYNYAQGFNSCLEKILGN